MILRFYAKGDALCPVPGQGAVHGAALNYVGRQQVPRDALNSRGETVKQATYPATKEPFQVDSDSDAGRRLKLICFRDGDVFPADQTTADHCQVPFVDVEHTGGAWVEKASKKVSK